MLAMQGLELAALRVGPALVVEVGLVLVVAWVTAPVWVGWPPPMAGDPSSAPRN